MTVPVSLFEPLDYNLLEIVRNWRNQFRVRNNMLNSDIISKESQERWYSLLSRQKTKKYFVFMQNENPIGMLYFDGIGTETLNWGCYLGEEIVWPGSGLILELAALNYAFKILYADVLNAEVLDFNMIPIKIHQFFGYIEKAGKIVSKNGEKIFLRCFFYKRKEWIFNRCIVLDKLPRNIRAAADLIYFK